MDISIIIPVYNLEKYIEDCLKSCLMQDIEHYEVICVDDGSQDASGAILDKYAVKYPEIIRVVHKSNGGVSSARNLGIKEAQGEFIWFVDGDDCIKPNCLGSLLQLARSEECEIISVQDIMFDENLGFDEILKIDAKDKNLDNIECIAFKIFKSDTIKQYGILFDETLTHGEDNIFIYEFMKNIKKHTVATAVVYYYRRRMNSASRSKTVQNKKKLYKSQLYQAKYYANEIKNFDGTQYFSVNDVIYRRDLFLKRALMTMCLFETDKSVIKSELSELEQSGLYPHKFMDKNFTGSAKEKVYEFIRLNLGKRWFLYAVVNVLHIVRSVKR